MAIGDRAAATARKVAAHTPLDCIFIGAAGALIAAVADITIKREVSTVVRMSEATSSVLALPITPIIAVAVLIIFGTVLTYASNVSDRLKSLYVGASIVSIIMTLVPTSLPKAVDKANGSGSALESTNPAVRPVVYTQVASTSCKASPVTVHARTTDGKPVADMVVTIREVESKGIVAQTRFSVANVRFQQPAGDYLLVIDVPGYEPEATQLSICDGSPRVVHADLKPTWKPYVLRRLFRSY